MEHKISRRRFLAQLAAAGALVPLMRVGATEAAGLPHLKPSSSMAKAMHYTDNFKSLSPKTEPVYKPGSHCGICALYQGGTKTWGPCPVFPGHDVHIDGWCESFSPKG